MEEKLKQYIELLAIDIKDHYNSTLWKEHALKNFYKIVGQIEPLVRQGVPQPVLLAEIIKQYGEQCPNCDNDGFTLEHNPNDPHENGCSGSCPIQVQCEFCYTNPKSKFNLLTDLENVLKRYENDSKQSA